MKTADKIIIYDDSCPMCNWYTGVFVRTGLLDKDGRQAFTNVQPGLMGMIDTDLCRNEIPLIDIQNKKVWYGTDALLEILGSRFPLLKSIFRLAFFKLLIKKLYKLISYNRRSIVAPATVNKGFDCTPDFNITYRLLFMVIGLTINSLLLFPFQQQVLLHSIFKNAGILQLQAAHLLLVVCNILAAMFLSKETAIEYLGQVNMLAIICTLLYIPLIVLNKALPVPELFNNIWLAAILFIVFKEYIRRMEFAGLLLQHKLITATNLFCLVLFIIYLIK